MICVPSASYSELMCGRFVQASDTDELDLTFDADIVSEELPEPSYNISPTQTIAVVIDSARDTEQPVRRIEPARWSLIPPWVTDGKPKFSTFNARSEDAASKASWKNAVARTRCLIPATGYFEWVTEGSTKTPFFIHGDAPLALAGLYSWWRATPDDEWMLTATILTMATVPNLAHIHDRTPVVVPKSFWSDWLDPKVTGDQDLVDAAVVHARDEASRLSFYEVAPVRGNGPDLIRPLNA